MAVDLLSDAKQLFNSEVVQKLGAVLGEPPDRVERAIAAGGPSILAGLFKAATDARDAASLTDALGREPAEASRLGSPADASARLLELMQGPSLDDLIRHGQSLLRSIFGDKLGGVMDLVADDSGVKPSSVSTIMGLLAPSLVGMIRKALGAKGMSLDGLRGLLDDQRDSIFRHIPSGLGDVIGARALADLGSSRPATNVDAPRTAASSRYATSGPSAAREAEPAAARWAVPAALVALLLLSAYFLVPRAGEQVAINEPAPAPRAGEQVAPNEPAPAVAPVVRSADEIARVEPPSAEPARPALADGGKPAIETAARGISLSLPGDMTIEVPEDSYIEAMVTTLREGKPAASRTFVASDLTFDRDGKLAAAADRPLGHIAKIAKAYPAVKFKVNGRETLKNVDPAAAREDARKHAEAVRDALVKAGVPAERVAVEVVAANLPAEHPAAVAQDDVPISISIVAE